MGVIKATHPKLNNLGFVSGDYLKTNVMNVSCEPHVNVKDVYFMWWDYRNQDETAGFSKHFYIEFCKLVGVTIKADAPTTMRILYSYDNIEWFTYYESSSPETFIDKTFWCPARYVKVEVDPAGSSGDKVSIHVGIKV